MTALISKLNITKLFTFSTSGMAELWFRCFEYYHAYRSGNTFNECLCVVLEQNLWEVVKVKFLMNSNITLTVLNLHQKTDPKVQQDFKGQGHYDKVKGQIKVTHNQGRCTPTSPNQCPYQVSTSYTLRFLRYSPDKIL